MSDELCEEGVTRQGEFQPCDKIAVAMRIDPEENAPYPVCAFHARGDMVPLSEVLRQQAERAAATRKDSLTVRTVAELDALPVGTVMLDNDGDAWDVAWEAVDGTEIRYRCTDGSAYYTSAALLRHGPFRIVWTPEETGR